jgi:hypothetical protein
VRLPRPTVALATVTAIVLGAVAVAARGSAAEHAAGNLGATTEPISSVELVCPVARSTKNVAQAVLSAAAPTISSVGGSSDGTISVYPVSATPRSVPLAAAARGSSVLHYPVPVGNVGPLEVRATGGYARGLTASVTTLTAAGAGRSLQTEQCTPSGGEGWFVGGGAAIGRRAVLYVTNIDTAPATVDVTVYTARGAQQPTPVQGRTIGPGRQFAIGIDALVPGATATAVHVLTRTGRVSAAVYDSQVNGLIAQGADWVPPTTAPTRHVVLTGIPGDAGALRTLGVVVPGPDDAVLNIHLVTADGTLSPVSLQGLSAPSGKLSSVDLSKVPTAAPFVVVVESDRPVVAGIRTVRPAGGAGKFPDFSYSAGTAPVEGAVMLPAAQHTATITTVLQLTAPGADSVIVDLTTLATSGARPTPLRVTVPAGQTLQIEVGALGAALSSVLVETAPHAAAVYVGCVLSEAGVHGPLVTGGPLPQTPLTLVLPRVESDPAVGYPGH